MAMSRQAKVILDVLRSVTSHPTADEVYEMAREAMPRISLGTVYRNLEAMSESGLVLKIYVSGTQKRFDGNPKPHYHIRCGVCGRVDDIDLDLLVDLDRTAQEATGYDVLSHSVEFVGVCPRCRNQEGVNAAPGKSYTSRNPKDDK
ncbi:MAG: transcriptional repressor [Armatimonadota bacterium]|nr:transcriptional repressor [bacterium]